MPRTPGLRARKHAQVKRQLFDIAVSLFLEKGFEQTTVEEIAERANVSRGTFFNYYGRKESVLLHFSELVQSKVEEALGIQEPGRTHVALLHDVLRIILEMTAAHREVVQMIYRYCPLDGGFLPGQTSARMRIFDMVIQLVDAAQRAGAMRTDMTARDLALYMLGTIEFAVISYMASLATMESIQQSAWQYITAGARLLPEGGRNPLRPGEGD